MQELMIIMDTQKPMISSKVINKDIKSEADIEADYNYSRSRYYELVDRGSDAIDAMLELATESDNPRAFEVLGRLIKDVADVNEKLIALQKTKKDLTVSKDVAAIGNNGTVNNNLFVGSTTELQRMLSGQTTSEKEVVVHDTDKE